MKFNKDKLPLFVLVCLFTLSAAAQSSFIGQEAFQLKSVSAENNLDESAIIEIHQDKNGFLWLGTISGLIRFDGHEYHTYKNIKNDSTSISDNFIYSILIDSENRIWVGTFGGLNLYDPIQDNFIRYLPENSDLSDGFINEIVEDNAGNLWIATYNGLNKFNPKSGDFELFYPLDTDNIPIHEITALTYHLDTLWIGTQKRGLYYLVNEKIDKYPVTADGFLIRTIFKNDDVFLLGSNDGLIQIDRLSSRWHDEATFTDIVQLRDNRILLCTNFDGLYKWDSDQQKPIKQPIKVDGKLKVDQNIGLSALYQDADDNIWFCFDGLKKLSTVSKMFKTFIPPHTEGHERSDKVINSIVSSNPDHIYLSTRGGAIHIFDYKTNKFLSSMNSPEFRESLIQNLFLDSDGHVCGLNKSNNLGIVREDGFEVKFNLQSITNNLNPFVIREISNCIYIGSPVGLICNYNKEPLFHFFQETPLNPDSLANNTVSAIYTINKDSIWIGSGSVLHLFLPEENKFIRYGKISSYKHFIQSLDEDIYGNIWLARNNGIAYWEKKSNRLIEINDNILGSVTFASLMADQYGNIWAGTTNGIVKYEPKTDKFTIFDTSYGAQNYYYKRSNAKSNDGRLIFGGLDGFTIFHPDDVYKDLTVPKVHFVEIDNGKGRIPLTKSVYDIDTISISQDYQVISFSFVGLHYNDPKGLIYSYYMEGLDLGWHNAGTRRYVSYSNLPRGKQLTLHLKATSPSGIVSPTRKIHLFVKPYFWETDWFIIISGTFLVLAVWISYRIRISGLKKRQKELKRQIQSATLEIQSQKKNIETQYEHIKTLSELGQNITSSVEVQEIINRIYSSINSLMEAPSFAIGQIDSAKEILFFWGYNNPTGSMEYSEVDLKSDDRMSVWCLNNRIVICMNDIENEIHKYLGKKVDSYTGNNIPKSSIYLPLFGMDQEVSGILVIKSYRKNVYSQVHLNILRNLATYIGIALENAKAYQSLQIQSKKIHELDDLKIKFYSNISHEFRTPLTLITGPVRNLIKNFSSTPVSDQISSLKLIERNGERLLRLINQLLDLSKLDEGALRLNYTKTDIIKQTKKIFETFIPLAKSRKIKFNLKTPHKLERKIDLDVFEKILFNLLSNAFKFTMEGSINLAVRSDTQNTLVIEVHDTGVGIDKHQLNNIFQRYNQGRNSTLQAGTGLGLTYVDKLTEAHGGSIVVESELGQGSKFIITLKSGSTDQVSISERNLPEPPFETDPEVILPDESIIVIPENYSDKRLNILVIDDNDDIRQFISSFLKKSCCITEATDGADGLNKAISTVPEIIVADIMMPAMNGLELCDKLKNNPITSHIPIILLTAKVSENDKMEGYKHGADSYITKPFSPETLKARILNLLDSRKSLRDIYIRNDFTELSNGRMHDPEKEFIIKCSQFMSEHLNDSELDRSGFCRFMGMSQTQLYRKLIAITGMPVSEFIKSFRLKKSYSLLKTGNYTISEVAYQVGFRDPSYFSKCFSKQFGFAPSKYLEIKQQD